MASSVTYRSQKLCPGLHVGTEAQGLKPSSSASLSHKHGAASDIEQTELKPAGDAGTAAGGLV